MRDKTKAMKEKTKTIKDKTKTKKYKTKTTKDKTKPIKDKTKPKNDKTIPKNDKTKPKKDKTKPMKDKIKTESQGSFHCDACPRRFPRKFNLQRHRSRVHNLMDEAKCFLCDECAKAFSTQNHLKVHLKKVHGNVTETPDSKFYTCEVCSKSYLYKRNLATHRRVIHQIDDGIKTEPHLCDICAKPFRSKNLLLRHQKEAHGVEIPNFQLIICKFCSKSFSSRFNLSKHKKVVHKVEIIKEYYSCDTCGEQFSSKKKIIKHLRREHRPVANICPEKAKLAEERRQKLLTCLMEGCHEMASNYNELKSHYVKKHDKVIQFERLVFPNEQEFFSWKEEIEKKDRCCFVKKNLVTKDGKDVCRVFTCNRSGFYNGIAKKRKSRLFGSRKINGYCPAEIQAVFLKDKVCVKYQKEHIGHDCSNPLSYMNIPSSLRSEIASQLAKGVPKKEILSNLRQSLPSDLEDREKRHTITTKDVTNIALSKTVGLGNCEPLSENDAENLLDWVKTNTHLVLFYKEKGCVDERWPLLEDDFVLIFRSDKQREMLLNFGNHVVAIDSTHDLDSYNFVMTTVLVSNYAQRACPVMFMFSNRCSQDILGVLFETVKADVGDLTVTTLMSDVAPEFHNAWCQVFQPPQYYFYCSWRVLREWRTQLDYLTADELSADKLKEVKKGIFQFMFKLMRTTNEEEFNKELNGFLKPDPILKDFHAYFNLNYLPYCVSWAHCYRLNSGVNTDMLLEAFHKVLNYNSVINGRKVRRLDRALNAVLEYLKDRIDDETNEEEKRKRKSGKSKIIRNRHKLSEAASVENVTALANGYVMESFKAKATESDESELKLHSLYFLECTNMPCTDRCKSRCPECKTCLHMFRCTCVDFQVLNNFCKHMHLLSRFLSTRTYDNEVVVDSAQTEDQSFEMINEIIVTEEDAEFGDENEPPCEEKPNEDKKVNPKKRDVLLEKVTRLIQDGSKYQVDIFLAALKRAGLDLNNE